MKLSIITFLCSVTLAFIAYGEQEYVQKYEKWVDPETGRTINVKLPGRCVGYFPLFPDEPSKEEILEKKDQAEELKDISITATGELKTEMARYHLRALRCDFEKGSWGALYYQPRFGKAGSLPLIVYIPGQCEIGEQLVRQFHQRTIFDVVLSGDFQKKHPCCLLALSPPADTGTFYGNVRGTPNKTQRRAMLMIEKLMAAEFTKSCIDTNRIYVVGMSFGGDAAYSLAVSYPETFAAAVPISAIPPSPSFISEIRPGNFWHVCSENEPVGSGVVLEALRNLKKTVVQKGGDFRLTVHPPTAGHDVWVRAWRESEIWNWVFTKSLRPSKSRRAAGATVGNRDAVALSMEGAICSSSVDAFDADCGVSRPIDFLQNTYYYPCSRYTRDDWWQLEMPRKTTGRARVISGTAKNHWKLTSGYVEISNNGKTWRRAASFSKDSGCAEFPAPLTFKYLRVRSTQSVEEPFALRSVIIYDK